MSTQKKECEDPYLVSLVTVLLLLVAVFALFVLEWTGGWILMFMGLLSLLFCEHTFRRRMLLMYLSLMLLALEGMSTDLDTMNIVRKAFVLPCVVLLPYVFSRYVYNDTSIYAVSSDKPIFSLHRLGFLILGVVVAAFVLPFYLASTGAWQNWSLERTSTSIFLLFAGMMFVGAWDELFFVNTIFNTLKMHFSRFWANVTQSIIFASVLYELGFKSWGFFMIFVFAFIQGRVYQKTQSLTYLITLHFCIDFVLFISMVYAHFYWA